jgi:hypothetical protein
VLPYLIDTKDVITSKVLNMETEAEEFDTTYLTNFSTAITTWPKTQFQQMPSHGNIGTKMNLQLVMES